MPNATTPLRLAAENNAASLLDTLSASEIEMLLNYRACRHDLKVVLRAFMRNMSINCPAKPRLSLVGMDGVHHG